MTRTILVVEDERNIADALALNLELAGYAVKVARTGSDGLRMAQEDDVDLVILDVMLPDLDGLRVCQRLRANGHHLPVLFLSARSEEDDRISGIEAGADDYLTKPFSMDELLARIAAMFRRLEWLDPGPTPEEDGVYRFHGGEVDFKGFTAIVDGTRHRLSEKETLLLKLFSEREGEVVDRFAILDRVWGYDAYPTPRAVDNLVLKLRKRFESADGPRYFHTIYGAGYRFTPTPEESES